MENIDKLKEELNETLQDKEGVQVPLQTEYNAKELQKLIDEVSEQETLKEEVSIEERDKIYEMEKVMDKEGDKVVTNEQVLNAVSVLSNNISLALNTIVVAKHNDKQEETLLETRMGKVKQDTEVIRSKVVEETFKVKGLKIFSWVLIGILFGMQDHVWLSYIGDIGNALKAFFQFWIK